MAYSPLHRDEKKEQCPWDRIPATGRRTADIGIRPMASDNPNARPTCQCTSRPKSPRHGSTRVAGAKA